MHTPEEKTRFMPLTSDSCVCREPVLPERGICMEDDNGSIAVALVQLRGPCAVCSSAFYKNDEPLNDLSFVNEFYAVSLA